MDAYVDLSYIYSVIVVLISPYYLERLLKVKVKIMDLVSLSVFYIVLYFNVFIFSEYKYINILFLLVYFLLVYFKKGIKLFIGFIFCYYSSISYSIILSNNFYLYRGVIFINSPKSFYIVLTAFLNIILIELIMLTIKKIKLLANYNMRVNIIIDSCNVWVSGYMDSGNTLIKNNKPVIFLNESYMKGDNYKEMLVSGMGERKCRYVEGKIIINDHIKDVVYAFVNGVSFKGCECLLNIHLLEENND